MAYSDKDDRGSIIYVQSLPQYYSSLDVLETLVEVIEMRLDFPFEHLLLDCIVFG